MDLKTILPKGNIMLIVIICILAVGAGLVSMRFLGNDNPVEQAAEAVIKEETGFSIDLSPDSQVQVSKDSSTSSTTVVQIPSSAKAD